MPSKAKELKRLQKEWYGKLADVGFSDIETFDKRTMEPFDVLKNNSFRQGLASMDKMESAEQYYILARQHLYHHDFPNDQEREIWELHSEGTSQRKIAIAVGIRRDKVRQIIEKNKKLILPNPKKAYIGGKCDD